MYYNLMDREKDLLRWFVRAHREGHIKDVLGIWFAMGNATRSGCSRELEDHPAAGLRAAWEALGDEGLVRVRDVGQSTLKMAITKSALDAVDSNFSESPTSEQELEMSQNEAIADPRQVFVVHGRNKKAVDGVTAFLQSLGLIVMDWSKAKEGTEGPNPYIGDILDDAFSKAQAFVVLLTGDELTKLRRAFREESDDDEAKLTPQPRPNVLFEAGMAWGKNRNRTILIELGENRPVSDLSGVHTFRFTGTPQDRKGVATALKKAGCDVNDGGDRWMSAGQVEIEAALELAAVEADEMPEGEAGAPRIDSPTDDDCRILIDDWMRGRSIEENMRKIVFAALEVELDIPKGTAKRFLRDVAEKQGYGVRTESDNMIILNREPGMSWI